MLCAYMLTREGVDCVVCEADTVGSGTTAGTTAKITAQHGLIYSHITDTYGKDAARLYLEANLGAVEKYAKLTSGECDFERRDTLVYSLTSNEALIKEHKALSDIGYHPIFEERVPLPFPTVGALRFKDQAVFDPAKLLTRISDGIRIYENTRILKISDGTATSSLGSVKAKKIIVATHFPIINKYGLYPLKMYQSRSYVIAVSGAPRFCDEYVDASGSGFSFRGYGDLLFIGSGAHRTAEPTHGWGEAEELVRRHFDGARVEYKWAEQDCITLDGMPYIGQYSKKTDGLYVATGFNKWGMTGSMIASEVLRDMILERKNEYASLFDPSRKMCVTPLFENIKSSFKGLVTPRTPRCPHLGCALVWNKLERSWDCPCHGSRFDGEGNILDTPATKRLKR